jgi:hypothetical protein
MTQVTIKHEYIFKKTTPNKLSEIYKILMPLQKSTAISSRENGKRRQLTCKK